MKKKAFLVFLGAVPLLFISRYVFADTVLLKSGQKIKCQIIEKTDGYVKVDVEGVSLTYPAESVQNVVQEGVSLTSEKSAGPNEAPAVDRNPAIDAISSIMSKGLQGLTTQDYMKIVEQLDSNKLPPLGQKTVVLYGAIGFSYYQLGKFQEALGMFKKIIDVDPNNISSVGMLGLTYKAMGDKDAAHQTLKHCIEMVKPQAKTTDLLNWVWFMEKLID